MNISYSQPLTGAWNRMKKALFQPFDLNKWLRLGFTAFLAGLVDCGGGNGGNGGNHSSLRDHHGMDEFFRFPQIAWDWLTCHPLWFNLIIIGLILLFLFISFLIWLSSRGKFMFLHNVATSSAEISKPWSEYHREGNSLFFFRFLFGWLTVAAFIGWLIYCFNEGKDLYYGDFPHIIVFWQIAAMIGMLLAIMIIAGYISLFLNDFIVPVMYRHRTGVIKGWSWFLGLFFRYPFHMIVYGLFIFVLKIVAAIAIVLFAVCTCCIGLLLLIIPYIGSVVLLPVSYTFRALSAEFLAQFGDEYNVFPIPEEMLDKV